MTDLTAAYRIETPIPEGKTYTAGEAWMVDWEEGFAIVPDTRLQAIADAWKTYMDTQALREDRWVGLYTLRGKVFDLLDELGGTDNEPI